MGDDEPGYPCLRLLAEAVGQTEAAKITLYGTALDTDDMKGGCDRFA